MKKKNKDRLFSKFLFEEENQVIPTDVMPRDTTQPQNYSLDQKVDHYIIQYERESNPSAAMFPDDGMKPALQQKAGTQGVSAGFGGGQSAHATPAAMSIKQGIAETKFRKTSLKAFLWEADEAPTDSASDPSAGTPDLAGGLGGGIGGGDDSGDGESKEINVPKPQINLAVFANKIARLINNFESLVNPKIILLNRAYAYIRQSYDENTAKELLIILESNYDLSNTKLSDKEHNLVGQVPFAVGAGDGSSGGGGT